MSQFSKILVATAPFKGLLSAFQAAEAIKRAVLVAQPGADVNILPMADGGSGTVQAAAAVLSGNIREIDVAGPMGNIVRAAYFIQDGNRAVIEMASAAGLSHVPPETRNPLRATTRGVGQLIIDAVNCGCREIVIGLGDSATIDVGLGMMSELGAKFLDSGGTEVLPLPENFSRISRVDLSSLCIDIKAIKFIAYADVTNPVLGQDGAVRVYGPQKGLTTDMIPKLEAGVERFVAVLENMSGIRIHDEPMTGAAGGLGAGIRAFLNGSLLRGAHAIAKLVGLDKAVENADLIITGEGRLDLQSLSGKVVSEVSAMAGHYKKDLWIVAGNIHSHEVAEKLSASRVIEVSSGRVPSNSEEAIALIEETVSKAVQKCS